LLLEVSPTALNIDPDALSLNCLLKLGDFSPQVSNSKYLFGDVNRAETTYSLMMG
jgi:hypothetical protein